jgi:hypothetical protein
MGKVKGKFALVTGGGSGIASQRLDGSSAKPHSSS